MPERIQLRRTKGWRKPEGAIVVARPSKWGNPFPVTGGWIMWTAVALGYKGGPAGRRTAAVALHRAWLTGGGVAEGPGGEGGGSIEFGSGVVLTVDQHVRGIAGLGAALETPPVIPRLSPLADIGELTGHDLCCWCRLDQPCHADVLLDLANGGAR